MEKILKVYLKSQEDLNKYTGIGRFSIIKMLSSTTDHKVSGTELALPQ